MCFLVNFILKIFLIKKHFRITTNDPDPLSPLTFLINELPTPQRKTQLLLQDLGCVPQLPKRCSTHMIYGGLTSEILLIKI